MFSIFRKIVDDNDEDWDEYMDGVLFVININILNIIKFSLLYLMYGRYLCLFFEV